MKYNINNLYFAKCRHCIMDIIMSHSEDDKVINPRPDYIDYYTVLLFKNYKYINVFDRKNIYIDKQDVDNDKEYYDADIILEKEDLSYYINDKHRRVNTKQCDFVKTAIEKSKSLKLEYGYKK